jgi:hypothetical protein
MLEADMTPEAEYFLAHCFLEAVNEGERHCHNSHAYGRSRNCQPDDDTGK